MVIRINILERRDVLFRSAVPGRESNASEGNAAERRDGLFRSAIVLWACCMV